MQRNTQVPVGKHNNRQHASPHHEVATDVKQMPIQPIIIIIIIIVIHRKYPSSDVNTIDRNIDYLSKCSSMIYDKTNVSQ